MNWVKILDFYQKSYFVLKESKSDFHKKRKTIQTRFRNFDRLLLVSHKYHRQLLIYSQSVDHV